jgi:hypothetical protein
MLHVPLIYDYVCCVPLFLLLRFEHAVGRIFTTELTYLFDLHDTPPTGPIIFRKDMIAGRAKDISEGIELANQSIDSGKAFDKLERLIEFTHAEQSFLRKNIHASV